MKRSPSLLSLGKARRVFLDALTESGRQSLVARVASRLAARVPPSLAQSHVLPSDVLRSREAPSRAKPRAAGSRLRIAWIVTPPIAGSGGHTTAFRMVSALERAGHNCELVLYDVFGGEIADREAVIRRGWPQLKARVRSLDDGLVGFDACIATGWQTAYALMAHSVGLDMHRLYFIQDYEPFFYPKGYEYELAEATYCFDIHRIALGGMVTRHLRALGAECFTVPFGCDTDTYTLTNTGERSGVAFYSRAGTTRRGFLLATMGLEEFNRRRPDVPIKVFGPLERTSFNFPVSWQGLQTPQQLNELYNSSIAGLGMSFTNISLVAGEMLAAGCVPVVNDSLDGRLDLASEFAWWVAPHPEDVATALVHLVDNPPADVASIAKTTNPPWSVTQAEFLAIVENVATDSAAR